MRNKSRNVLFVSLTALSLALILLLSCDSDISKNSGTSDDTITAVKYEKIYSKILNEERKLIIHLPPGYEKTSQAYPVLYLLDADWDSLFLLTDTNPEHRKQSPASRHHRISCIKIWMRDPCLKRHLLPTCA